MARFGVSLEDARAWIFANVERPQDIHAVARSAGITNTMLAEIIGLPGITGVEVSAYFSARGLNGRELDDNPSPSDRAPDDRGDGDGASPVTPRPDDNPSAGDDSPGDDSPDDYPDDDYPDNQSPDDDYPEDDAHSVLPDELASLVALVTPNLRTGDLSNESLRAAALAKGVTDVQYDALFDPSSLDENRDGTLQGSELGLPSLPAVAATPAALESLVYGTLLNLIERVDAAEASALDDFAGDDSPSSADFVALLVSVFDDMASPPVLQGPALRDAVAAAVATAVVVGVGGEGPLERLYEGLLSL